jgi:hypothetical protein
MPYEGTSGITILPQGDPIGKSLGNVMNVYTQIKKMKDAEDAEKMKRFNSLIDVSMKGWMEQDKEELYNKRQEFVNRSAEIYRKTNGYPGFKEQQELDNMKDQLGSLMTESLAQQAKYKKIAETAFLDKTNAVDKEATAAALEDLLKVKGIENRSKANWDVISLNYDLTKYIGDSMNKWVDMFPQERIIYKKVPKKDAYGNDVIDANGKVVMENLKDVNTGAPIIDYFETIKSVNPTQVEKWWANIKKEPEIRKEALKRFQNKFGANPRDDKELDEYIDTYKPEFGTSKTFKGKGGSGSQVKPVDPSAFGPTTETFPSGTAVSPTGGKEAEVETMYTYPFEDSFKANGITPQNWNGIVIIPTLTDDVTAGDMVKEGGVGKNNTTVMYKKGDPVPRGMENEPGIAGHYKYDAFINVGETETIIPEPKFIGDEPKPVTTVKHILEHYDDLKQNKIINTPKLGKGLNDFILKKIYELNEGKKPMTPTSPEEQDKQAVEDLEENFK